MNQLKFASDRVAGLVALSLGFFAQVGCEGVEQAIGQTGAALDLEHCYGEGTNCSPTVAAVSGSMPEVQSCSDTELGDIERDQTFALEFKTSCPVAPIKVASDGTIWALESEGAPVVVGSGSYCNTTYQYLHLAHYSAEGTLLGESPTLSPQFGEIQSYSLNVDAAGNALVTFGEVSDGSDAELPATRSSGCENEVATTIRIFDGQLQQVGEPFVLRGLDDSQVVSAEPGVLTIAGTRVTSKYGSNNSVRYPVIDGGTFVAGSTDPNSGPVPSCIAASSQGTLLRLKDRAPEFIQTTATNPAKGRFSTIEGMVAGNEGASFAMGHYRSIDSDPGLALNSLMRFDAQGNLVWELELPDDGASTSLCGAVDGGVIVNDGSSSARVFHVSPSGTIDWAYQGQSYQGFVTDADTGMAFAHRRKWSDDGISLGYSLLTISGDGSRCQMYGLLESQTTDTKADVVTTVVRSPYVYLQRVTDIRRYRLPTP